MSIWLRVRVFNWFRELVTEKTVKGERMLVFVLLLTIRKAVTERVMLESSKLKNVRDRQLEVVKLVWKSMLVMETMPWLFFI